MSKDRIVIPGIPTDAARAIIDRLRAQEERIALLERKGGRPGIVTVDTAAKVGEFLNIEAPTAGLTIVLPQATQALRNARVTLAFRNENEVRIVCVLGTVNGEAFVINNLPGTYEAICDGLGGWAVQVGVTEDGVIGTPGAPGALADIADQRVLGNDSGVTGPPTAITVHQELDWLTSDALWLFDGVDDRVDYGDVLDIERTDSVTLSAWIRTPSAAAAQAIISKIGAASAFQGYEFGIEAPGKLYFLLSNNAAIASLINAQTATGTVPVGALIHIAAVYAGTSLATGVTFYINGALVATSGVAGPGPIVGTTVTANNLAVGRSTSGASPFAGEIHHVSRFAAALTAAQILEVYNAGTPPDLNALATTPDPVWWMKLDAADATGASGILDYGTGSNEGTAGGGLNPGSLVGSLITRSTAIWQTIPPGTDGLPLVSQGTATIPAYEALPNAGMAAMAANTYKGNATGSSAAPTDVAISGLAGAGMTATGSVLNVIGSTSITVNANDVQRPALTGFAAASANSNATTSAEPIVTYSASANMSAERVTTASTSITINTGVASQIAFERAAISGAVVIAANANTSVFAGILNNAVATTDRTNLNFVGFTFADDAGNDRIVITAPLGVTDGDKGDITVSATGTVWTVDTDISKAWSGVHSFTGSSFIVNSSGTAQLLGTADVSVASSTGGLWLSAGHTPVVSPSVSNGDVLINASNGAGLFALATPQTNVGVGDVELSADGTIILTTNAVERLQIEADGAWQLAGDQGDSDQVITSEGSAAAPTWRYPRKRRNCCEWNEDFFCNETGSEPPVGLPGTNVGFGNTNWIVTHNGAAGAAALLPIAAEAGHPGILRIETGATSGNTVTIMNGDDNGTLWVRGDQILEFEAVARHVVTSTSGFFIGFSEDPRSVAITGVGNSNIIGFFFDTAGAFTDTTIHCITREADGTATDTDSAIAPSGGWQVFTIRQTTLGTVEFLIDDAIVATHSTQVPDSETMNSGITCITRTASNRQLDVDYVSFTSHELDRTAG